MATFAMTRASAKKRRERENPLAIPSNVELLQVLRLMEMFNRDQVASAVTDAIRIGTLGQLLLR